MFCRHNRLEVNCPICAREKAPQRPATPRKAAAGTRHVGRPQAAPAARRHGSGNRAGHLVTKRMVRATDDGWRSDLVPGVKATADAERLAGALTIAAARLDPPGPYPAVAEAAAVEAATWLAFLLAVAGPDRPELQQLLLEARPPLDGADGESGLGDGAARTIAAYHAWWQRAGSQEDAISGDNSWTPQRRFDRTFDRLSLPGFGRGARFEFLLTLAAAGIYEIEPSTLHVAVAHDVPTTLAAKRALNSGDAMLLERRAAALAEAAGLPLAALDRGLALWDRPGQLDAPADDPRLAGVRAALHLG